ncbi:hypothetical protein OG563_43130 [Nocardia vinacea]|uniref:Uncharacterized protein n=1 Tax=Nocardia vinacea TaxID=96468 RepID=A0ABZ1YRB0_9NOCA|nr:hypothetical protein [Nocardia vinacea]
MTAKYAFMTVLVRSLRAVGQGFVPEASLTGGVGHIVDGGE